MAKKTTISCLNGIVGLSIPSICPSECIPEVGITEVDTMLYLNGYDEGAIDILDLIACIDCESTEIWNHAEAMLEQATAEFMRVFDSMLTAQKTQLYPDISTTVGDYQKSNGPWITSEQYAVGKITPINCVDGFCMRIKEVSLWMVGAPADEEFEVFLYSDRDLTAAIDSVKITVSPKGSSSASWTLPLADSQGDICYFLVYDKKGYQPKDTLWNCGCSGSVRKWEKRLMMNSCSVNTIGELEDFNCSESYSAGLSFQGSIKCDPFGFICDMDFTCGYGLQIAKAIQLIFRRMAAFKIADCSQKNAVKYGSRIEWYNDQIKWNMQWLVQEYSSSFSGCYICDDGPDYSVQTIEI